MIRVAIAGTGWIAHEHVLALRAIPDVEIVAVSSSSLERARAFARSHGIPEGVAPHVTAITAPGPDVVHICSTNAAHYGLCAAAIENRKHVVCEKPLAVSSAETAALMELVGGTSLVHACNYNYRAYPMVQHARKLVRAGEIGEVQLIHGSYTQDWLLYPSDHNWRLDPETSGISAATGDIGSHWLDLAEHMTGRLITDVFARLRTAVPERYKGPDGHRLAMELDDSAVISLALDNGAVGSLVVSQVAAGHKNDLSIEIAGSLASLSWSQENPDQLWIGRRDGPNQVLLRDPAMAPDEILPAGHPFGWRDALHRNFDSIYRRVRNPADIPPVPYATFVDGHRGLELLEATVLSASSRGSVSAGPSPPTGSPARE